MRQKIDRQEYLTLGKSLQGFCLFAYEILKTLENRSNENGEQVKTDCIDRQI